MSKWIVTAALSIPIRALCGPPALGEPIIVLAQKPEPDERLARPGRLLRILADRRGPIGKIIRLFEAMGGWTFVAVSVRDECGIGGADWEQGVA